MPRFIVVCPANVNIMETAKTPANIKWIRDHKTHWQQVFGEFDAPSAEVLEAWLHDIMATYDMIMEVTKVYGKT